MLNFSVLENVMQVFVSQALRQRKIWTSKPSGVQVLPAVSGLRPAHGWRRRTRPRVWVHPGHSGSKQVRNIFYGCAKSCVVSVDELTSVLFYSGMETCPCRSTWPSWSAEKQRMWNQARRSRALSVLSAPRTNLTSPRKNSTRYKITNPCYLQLVLDQYQKFGLGFMFGFRKMILMTLYVFTEPDEGTGRLLHFPYEALPGQQGPRDPVSIRLCGIHPLAFRQLIPRPPPASDQSGCVFPPHNTRPNCMDLKWKFSIASSIAISVSCYHS